MSPHEQRVLYKKLRQEAAEQAGTLLKDRYNYSFEQMLKDLDIAKSADLVKLIIHNHPSLGCNWQRLIELGVREEVANIIKPLKTNEAVIASMNKLIQECWDKGARYIRTDKDVADAYHNYTRSYVAEQATKLSMNSISGARPSY